MSRKNKQSSEAAVRGIRCRTRRKFSAGGEVTNRARWSSRRDECGGAMSSGGGIAANLHYRWSKDFLEAGKSRLSGDIVREANSDEVKQLVRARGLRMVNERGHER